MGKSKQKFLVRRPALSVLLPTHDNAGHLSRHLPSLVQYLKTLGVSFEIIVCDDGSADFASVREAVQAFGCRLVRLKQNRGKGAAVRAGMRAAHGRVRLFTDNDVPFEFSAIGEFFRTLDAGAADLVCGDRSLARSRYFKEISWARRLESRLFAFFVRPFVGDKDVDTQCGIKAFRAEVAEDLFRSGRIDRYAFDVELLHLAYLRGYSVKRHAVKLRVTETSQIRPFMDGLRMVWDLLRIARYHRQGLYREGRKGPASGALRRTGT